MPGDIRWIFVEPLDRDKSDHSNHGSCVLSKVVSPMFGTAKKANVVVVKMPTATVGGDRIIYRQISFLRGLTEILNDVRGRGFQGKAVLNLSMGCKYKDLKTQFICEYLLIYVKQFGN